MLFRSGLSLVAASGGHSSSRCAGLSPSRPLLLRSTGCRRAGSVIVAHGPSCSAACGIFPDQGLNPCPLHWQADSQPLRHQGSPRHPVFAPGSSEMAVGVGFFWSFISFGSRICPNCACTQLFLVPYSFFVFCSLRRGVSRCKRCSKGSQVPGLSHSPRETLHPYS